jgi:hypothetical protein
VELLWESVELLGILGRCEPILRHRREWCMCIEKNSLSYFDHLHILLGGV